MKKLSNDISYTDFKDPDPFHEIYFPSVLEAKRAIYVMLGTPLTKLSDKDREVIDNILKKTMEKKSVLSMVKDYFKK